MRPLNPRLLSRRTMLRAAGVAIALPLLDAMLPAGLGAEQKAAAMRPKRMVLVGRPLGLHAPFLFPTKPWPDYESTRYLKLLEPHRAQITVFSGISHPASPTGHFSEAALFPGVGPAGIRTDKNIRNTASLDHVAAGHVGTLT